jgi:hypothetical protein
MGMKTNKTVEGKHGCMEDRENFRFCLPRIGDENSRNFWLQKDGPRTPAYWVYWVGECETWGGQLQRGGIIEAQ